MAVVWTQGACPEFAAGSRPGNARFAEWVSRLDSIDRRRSERLRALPPPLWREQGFKVRRFHFAVILNTCKEPRIEERAAPGNNPERQHGRIAGAAEQSRL